MFLLLAFLVSLCSLAWAAPTGNETLDIPLDLIPYRSSNFSDYGFNISDLVLARATKLNTCECAKPVQASGRIVGGKEVSPKYRLPYQVLFVAGPFECGATIINKRYVITAAHCLFDQQNNPLKPDTHKLLIVAGEHNVCDGLNEGGQAIKVEKVWVRSDYGNQANDFAIMRVAQEIKFTDKVKPACLPEKADKDYSGLMATISGWGGTIGYGPFESQPKQPRQCEMKETSVKIIPPSNELCQKVTRGDSKTRLCAWAKGTDSCQGDSGGPLTVVEDGKYVLVGVVSYGPGCASKYPGAYARVQNYLDWIKPIVKDGDCDAGSSSGTTSAATTAAPTAAPTAASTAAPTAAPTTASSGQNYNYNIDYSQYGYGYDG